MRSTPTITVLAAFVALAIQGVSAPAGPAPAAETVKAPAPTAREERRMICKKTEVTGTRFTTQECHTAADWAAMTADARRFTDKMTTGPCMVGCRGH